MVTAWPLKSLHALRAVDVIYHYLPQSRSQSDPITILEIGSGPAIVCGMISHMLHGRYVIIDLPEQASIAYSLLAEFFPEKRTVLPNEIGPEGLDWNLGDIYILTPEQITLIPDECIDVAINTFSFMEMSIDAIEEYFSLLRRSLRAGGIFYCVNRLIKSLSLDGTRTQFSQYPWFPKDNFLHDVTHDPIQRRVILSGGPYRECIVQLEVPDRSEVD